jgi:large subunit ribosomal protein L7/L12
MGILDGLSALFGGGGPKPEPPTPGGSVEVHLDAVGPRKISVIKAIREATGLGLKESKDLADRVPSTLYVHTEQDARALVHALHEAGAKASTTAGESPPPAEAGQRFVTLRANGVSKITLIKVIREHLGSSLAQSKAWVDASPSEIGPLDEEKALALMMALGDVGGDAEIR